MGPLVPPQLKKLSEKSVLFFLGVRERERVFFFFIFFWGGGLGGGGGGGRAGGSGRPYMVLHCACPHHSVGSSRGPRCSRALSSCANMLWSPSNVPLQMPAAVFDVIKLSRFLWSDALPVGRCCFILELIRLQKISCRSSQRLCLLQHTSPTACTCRKELPFSVEAYRGRATCLDAVLQGLKRVHSVQATYVNTVACAFQD